MQTLCFILFAVSSPFLVLGQQNSSTQFNASSSLNITEMPIVPFRNHSRETHLAKLKSFNGTGCPSDSDVMLNASEWEMNIDFAKFAARYNEKTTCILEVPVNLHGGCLVGMLQSASLSGQADAQIDMEFNGVKRKWCTNQLILDQNNPQGSFLLAGPVPPICGHSTTMDLAITLKALNESSASGSFKNLLIKFVNLCNEDFCGNISCTSDSSSNTPKWFYLLIPVMALAANQ